MSERRPLLSLGEWTLVFGVGLGIIGTLFVQHLFPASGPTWNYPVYVSKSARSLITASSCVRAYDGTYWITGNINAPPDSGILKINGLVNFGNIGQSKYPNNVPSVYTYFDTNDPAYQTDGGGSGDFFVNVDPGAAGIAELNAVRYCWVTARYL